MQSLKSTLFILSSLLLISCVSMSHAQNYSSPVSQTSYKPIAYSSEYTSLKEKHCRTIEYIEDAGDYYRADCPSKPPYKLEVEGGDLRYGLNVIYQKGKTSKTVRYWYAQFFSVSDTVEWRYTNQHNNQNKEQKNYHALIYRIYSADSDAEGRIKPDKQELFVVRLAKEKTCILGKISASSDMNIKARQLADDMTAICPVELNESGEFGVFFEE